MANKTRRYWDSNCFIGWLRNEDDKAEYCNIILESAKKGETEIITSAFTITEVLHLKGEPPLNEEDKKKVEALFEFSFIKILTVTRHVAEKARDVVWHHGVLPKDAIHVASAILSDSDTLETFDNGLLGKNGTIKIGNGNIFLKIKKPHFIKQEQLDFNATTELPDNADSPKQNESQEQSDHES